MNKFIGKGIWIFGDYRSRFYNFLTLQLINKAKEIADRLEGYVGIILIGSNHKELIREYSEYGADKIFIINDEKLERYSSDLYTSVITGLVEDYQPEILLIPGSDFGREVAPRVACRLNTGLSSDCISLDVDSKGNLIQICTVFAGDVLAEIITPNKRPQIATIRPGMFTDPIKRNNANAELIKVMPDLKTYKERVVIKSSAQIPHQETKLEKAENVICVGRGVARNENVKKVEELAVLIDAEIGCTRPLIDDNIYDYGRLIGQTGKNINTQFLFVIGASGATHLTSSFKNSKCIVAINKNPGALIFNYCDIGIVGDAGSILSRLLKELRK